MSDALPETREIASSKTPRDDSDGGSVKSLFVIANGDEADTLSDALPETREIASSKTPCHGPRPVGAMTPREFGRTIH